MHYKQLASEDCCSHQSVRKVRRVETRVPLPTSSEELVGLCFSTHSCPPALAAEPLPMAPRPLLLGPADTPDDRAPTDVREILKTTSLDTAVGTPSAAGDIC